MKYFFYDLTFSDLEEILAELKQPLFSAQQIFNWVYRKKVLDITRWTNISKTLREWCHDHLDFQIPSIVWNGQSRDGTRKFLVKLHDGKTIETVAIAAPDRLTLCISSQVGCAIGCTFCHTGTQGLTRHLFPREILGQYLAVELWLNQNAPGEKLTNIVYMGQGEPLHNFQAVKKATENFLNPHGLGLGQRRITLSTSGLVPQIEKLFEFPPVNIAISLHSAFDDARSELMPINKVYDLKKLFTAIKSIPLKAHRRITYEYLLIDGLNDRLEDAEALGKLLTKKESKINLIPFNEYPDSKYRRPSKEKITWFMDQLIKKGFVCTVRTTKGDDILAACGQLKTQIEKLNLWEEKVLTIDS